MQFSPGAAFVVGGDDVPLGDWSREHVVLRTRVVIPSFAREKPLPQRVMNLESQPSHLCFVHVHLRNPASEAIRSQRRLELDKPPRDIS